MLRTLILTAALCGAFVLAADAKPANKGEAKKRKTEQKTTLKELKDKYDADKDGKLSKEERASVSTEDKAKLKKIRSEHKRPAKADSK